MQEDNIKVVGVYLRVSTEDQAKEGFSLKEQKAKITEYCNFRHYEIYDYYEDAGVSAKTGNKRPEFERLLEDAKNKKLDTIMVVKLDRLSRSIYDLEKLMKLFEEYEIKLYCLYDEYNTTNANGRLVARLMMSVSQNEIERTSERTKFGMDGAIKEGHIPGLTPIGYRRENKCLVVDPVDAELVKRIFTMYSRGISHFLIAKQLTEEGIKGKLWHDSVIGKIVRNPVYKGDYILNRGKKTEKYYKDVCPRIVDDELWNYCQAQAPKNLRHYKRDKEYIFLQKLNCPTCGRTLGGKATRKKNGVDYYYYHCMVCNNNINESKIEKEIINVLNEIFEYDGIVNSYYFPLLKNKLNVVEKDYDKEIKILKSKKDRIADAYISGTFDKEMYEKKSKEIDRQIAELQKIILENNQLDKLTFAKEDILVMRDLQYINKLKLPMLYDKFLDVWKKCSRERKTNIVMDFIDHIDLKQVGKIITVEKVMFRDSFYDNFHKLFEDGYIDATILPPAPNENVKIRFSNYRPREEVINHIEKLRYFYDVSMFPGFMNFDTGEFKHTMPEDYDYVRLFPANKIEFKDGYHGIHEVYALGVLRDDLGLDDSIFDDEKVTKKIEEILANSNNKSKKEVITIE